MNDEKTNLLMLVTKLEDLIDNHYKLYPSHAPTFSFFIGKIVVSLTKLYIYYDKPLAQHDLFWFTLTRSFDEDFGSDSSIYQCYLKLSNIIHDKKEWK